MAEKTKGWNETLLLICLTCTLQPVWLRRHYHEDKTPAIIAIRIN